MKTYMAKPEDIDRKWYVIDAEGKVFGRVASQVASILRGKNKPIFTPHVDTGDYVIVVNVDKLVFTGNKLEQKVYYHHSGRPGHLKETTYRILMEERPVMAFEKAVKGMLPKNSIGKKMFSKLKAYAGPEHEQSAQKPEKLEVK